MLLTVLGLLGVAAGCAGFGPGQGIQAPEHGVRLTYTIETGQPIQSAVSEVVSVLEQRLTDAGVERSRVLAGEGARVVVELDETGLVLARPVLTLPGRLGVHAVDDSFGPALGLFLQSTEGTAEQRTSALHRRGDLPPSRVLYFGEEETPYIVASEPVVSGGQLVRAEQVNGLSGPSVLLKLSAEGADTIARASEALVGQRLAVVFDEEVLSAPVLQQPIRGGQLVMSLPRGDVSSEVVHALVAVTRSGELRQVLHLEAEENF